MGDYGIRVREIAAPEDLYEPKPMTRLSDHFWVHEFACKHCGSLGPGISVALLRKLEEFREALGRQPISVRSGFRCPQHNRAVGGAPSSFHLIGEAADIVHARLSPEELYKAADEFGFAGVGLYRNFVHVDVGTGPYRPARWDER